MAKMKIPLLVFCLFFFASCLFVYADPFGWVGRSTGPAPVTGPPLSEAPAPSVPEVVAPAVELDPLTAEVPSLCGHPAGRFVNGALPVDASRMGDAYVMKYRAGQIMWANLERPVKSTDTITAVLAVGCNKGGVAWPDSILAYNRSAELIGHVTLDAVTGGGRERLNSLTLADEVISARWATEGEGDAACCGTIIASSNFTLDPGRMRLVAGEVSRANEEQPLNSLLEAINAADKNAAARYAKVEAVDALASVRDLEGNLHLHRCYGLQNSKDMPAAALKLFKKSDASGNVGLAPGDGIVRLCVVVAESKKTMVIGYSREDPEQWVPRLILGK